MKRKNWNTVQPKSIRNAMELCVHFAKAKKNLSVEQIAECMGLSGHHALYKYLSNGRIPAVLIRPFEMACGCNYLTRYIAHSAQLLTIKIPTGAKSKARDINNLQHSLNDAASALIDFTETKIDADECLYKITGAMEDLAYHRANVEKSIQPEFELFEDEDL